MANEKIAAIAISVRNPNNKSITTAKITKAKYCTLPSKALFKL